MAYNRYQNKLAPVNLASTYKAGPLMSHLDIIQQQFSRQAVPFSEARSMSDADAIDLLIEASCAQADHCSLDIACGPGMVALRFAKVVRWAVGLETTKAMLDRAKVLQQRQSCSNVEWILGEAASLPFPDGSFDIVTCRFAVHHMLHPAAVLQEMIRVVRPGKMIVICDGVASNEAAKADAFNAFERMRDPSTVRFLTADQLRALVTEAGLNVIGERSYRVPTDLEGLLRTSFPRVEDVRTLTEIMVRSAENDGLGLATKVVGDQVLLSYPALILSARRAL
jgi:ubiquinone/menaquinone biosynthesis C-methylase UbiE